MLFGRAVRAIHAVGLGGMGLGPLALHLAGRGWIVLLPYMLALVAGTAPLQAQTPPPPKRTKLTASAGLVVTLSVIAAGQVVGPAEVGHRCRGSLRVAARKRGLSRRPAFRYSVRRRFSPRRLPPERPLVRRHPLRPAERQDGRVFFRRTYVGLVHGSTYPLSAPVVTGWLVTCGL